MTQPHATVSPPELAAEYRQPSLSLRRFAREAILPKDWFGMLVMLVLVFRITLPILNLYHTMPGAGIDIIGVYRPGGDVCYYDLVQSVAQGNMGETSLLEQRGFGYRSFPINGVMIHGLCYRALGPAGYFVGDLITVWIYSICCVFMLRCLGVGLSTARAVMILTLAVDWYLFSSAFGPSLLNFWMVRFPRPAATVPQLLLSLAMLGVLATSIPHRRRWAAWVILGFCVPLTLQGDLHTGITLGIFTGALGIWIALRGPAAGITRLQLLNRFGVMVAVGGVALFPFLLARLREHPDAAARLGRIPVSRLHPFFDRTLLPYAVATVIATGLVALAYRWLSRQRQDPQTQAARQLTALLPGALALSYFALPISIVTLGQGAQLFHFRDTQRYLFSFFLAGGLGLVVQAFGREWLVPEGIADPRARRVFGAAKVGVLLLTISALIAYFGFGTIPEDPLWVKDPKPGMRQAFIETAQYIRPLRDQGFEVVDSFDNKFHVWWVNMLGAHSYMPQAFASTLPDKILEQRYVQFCKLNGMTEDQFDAYTRTFEAQWAFIGVCKYNATRTYALAPLSDYEPQEQKLIQTAPRDSAWNLAIPLSERGRLRKLFRETSIADRDLYRLDAIVLRDKDWQMGMKPPTDRFHLVFENAFYQVWRRQELVPAAPKQ